MGYLFALRLMFTITALLTAAHLYSREAAAMLMPMLSAALNLVADDFKILAVELFPNGSQATSIRVLARLEHTLVLNGRAIVPTDDSMMLVTTAIGGVLQPVLVALSLVLAWRADAIEMAVRLAFAGMLLAVVLLLDTPLSISAWLWDTQLRKHEPDRVSPLIWWNVFLNGGGRLVLGLIAAVLAIVLSRIVCAHRRSSTTRTATAAASVGLGSK